MFADVIDGYKAYRGQQTQSSAPQQQPTSAQQQHRTPTQTDRRTPGVLVNREQRRASIPQQPARSAAPPPIPSQAVGGERKPYSQSIAEMRAQRKRGVAFRRAV